MAPTIINMPAIVADATDAVLQAWLVAEGDTVSVGTPIADIETEKATVEFEAESAGVIGKLLAASGDRVEVGGPVAVLLAEGEGQAELEQALAGLGGGTAAAEAPAAEAKAEAPAASQTPAAPAAEAEAEAAPAAAAPAPSAPAAGASAPQPAADGTTRVFASPLARKLARDGGIDLATLTGTGPGGRIVRADVQRGLEAAERSGATAGAAAPTATAPAQAETTSASETPAGATDTPMSPMRRAIARRLTESKTQVPHFYVTRAVEMDALLELRKQINASIGEGQRRVSVNDLVIKAVAKALVDVPAANAILVGESIRHFDAVDIAVAIAVPDGLLTPVVRGADTLSVGAISAKMGDFQERAKAGRIKQNELEGGAFSISNLGMYGVDDFSAILNPPQSGILAVSAASQQAVVRDGELAIATLMNVTLSADHRVIDGAVAAEFVAAFAARIETPMTLLV